MSLAVHGNIKLEGTRKANVVIEGDTPGEVGSATARALALQAAAGHIHNAGISSQSGAYPVDPGTGKPFNPFPTDADGNLLPPVGVPVGARYRQDFTLQAGL